MKWFTIVHREMSQGKESSTPWVTTAVIAQKSKPIQSSKGTMYSRWTLADLDGRKPNASSFTPPVHVQMEDDRAA